MRIWVIRVWWLWDSIVFSPFLRELRKLYPNDEITLFVQHNSSWEYFSRIKYVNKLEYIDKNRSMFTKIWWIFKYFKRYDLVIDTINWSKISCIIANLFWKKSIWFGKHWKYLSTITSKEFDEIKQSKMEQDATILNRLKWTNIEQLNFGLDFPLNQKDYNYTLDWKYVVFHTWTSKQRDSYYSKNLSDFQIDQIIDIIISYWYKCVVVWKSTDLEIANIKRRKNLIIKNNLSVRELWALIDKSYMFIWANSGPMWIAMALNKKAIIINWWIQDCWIPQEKFFNNVNNINCEYNWCCKCWLYTCKYNKDPKEQWLCIKNLDLNIIKDLILKNK